MKKYIILTLLAIAATSLQAATIYKPWSNGPLKVSANQRYLVHDNGTPFFWLGNTYPFF